MTVQAPSQAAGDPRLGLSQVSQTMGQKWLIGGGQRHLDRWKGSQSVYDVYSRSRRRTLLALVAAGECSPYSQT
jgi:hypothetical protein